MKWFLLVSAAIGIGAFALYAISRISEFNDYVAVKSTAVEFCSNQALQEAMSEYIESRPGAGVMASEIIAYRFSAHIREDFNSSNFEMGVKRWIRTYWAKFLVPRTALVASFCALGNAGGSERNLEWLFGRVIGRDKPFAMLERCEVSALLNTYFTYLGSQRAIDQVLEAYESSKALSCKNGRY
jgi:hypothetical protein